MGSARFMAMAILGVSVCANAQVRTINVSIGQAETLNSLSANAFDAELKRLLSPAGIELSSGSESKNADSRPIVGVFKGGCSAETLRLSRAASVPSSVLAEAPILNDQILPFFKVDCGRIVRILEPALRSLSLQFRQQLFGRAVARVVAHEIYHILAQTADHDISGVARPQLSFENLVASQFDLSPSSLTRIRASSLENIPLDSSVHPAALEWMQR